MMITIVIPTYNEKDNLRELAEKIFAQKIPGLEIIFVDDNSPDGTAGTIRELALKYPIHLIARPAKLGIGSAYIAGFKKALALGADFIFEMDADLSHDPADIPRLLAACETGVDLAIGSRRVAGGRVIGWSPWRHFTSAGAMWFARLILGLKARDVTAGFRCFRRLALEKINLDDIHSNGYALQEELLYKTQKAGLAIKEIPVVFNDRTKGKSKLSKKDIVEFFTAMLKLRFSA